MSDGIYGFSFRKDIDERRMAMRRFLFEVRLDESNPLNFKNRQSLIHIKEELYL
jgi:hypothetical protein